MKRSNAPILPVLLCLVLAWGAACDRGQSEDRSGADAGPVRSTDPGERGPFEVGNQTLVFVDPSRQCPFAGGDRTLVTEVWYPAKAEAAALPRNVIIDFWEDNEDEAVGALLDYGVLPGEIDNFYTETSSARDAPPNREAGPYPWIVYSHGWTNYRFQNFALFEHLASHGFVVVSADHPGDAFFAAIPDNPTYWDGAADPLFFLASLDMRRGDVLFLLDTLLDRNDRDPDGFFTGMLASTQIGVLGFSLGGMTVLGAARADPRIGAVASMTSAGVPGGTRDMQAALLFMFGLEDRTLGIMNPLIRIQYDEASPPKFLGVFPLAGHHSFQDACILRPSMGQGDGCGTGTHVSGGGEFTFPGYATMQGILRPYLTAFMGFGLRGDEAMRAYLQENHAAEHMDWSCLLEEGHGETPG